MGDSLEKLGALVVGSPSEVVVFDETVVGIDAEDGWKALTKRINKKGRGTQRSQPQNRTQMLVAKRVLKQLPARTVDRNQKARANSHKLIRKPSCKKLAVKKTVQKKKDNFKNAGIWLWIGVVVGKGKACYTHTKMALKK